MRWSRQPPIPVITENRRGRSRPRKGRKGKRQGMPRCWPPSRETLWQTLSPWRTRHEANAQSVDRRDIWAKECPNHDRSPKIACYKCHQLGHWAALCPGDPRASRSGTKPSVMMVQQDWSRPLHPACLSQTTIMGLEPRVQLDVAGRSENFLVDTGTTYSVLTSFSWAFSSQTCTILGAIGKAIRKRFTWALGCWDGQIFSHQLLVVPERPTPLLGRDLSLPSKSCSYCSPDRRCFKTLSWGQTIFTTHQVKQLLNGRGHLWMSDHRILRYQVVLMENPGLTISPCEVLNPATLLPTPEGSLPFHSCLATLDHWTKP